MASLMRCGNSLFRRIIEKVTTTIGGAPFNTLLTGCFSTLLQGFVGENQNDMKAWWIKTHYPYVYPFCKPISGSKAVCLVRNPFDTMVSIWQLSVNMTHTRSMLNDFPNEWPEDWDWFVKEHIKIYAGFYEYWMK
jgi:hypothetical protein